MKERIGIRLCSAFIYVLLVVKWFILEHGDTLILEMLPYYFFIACIMTLILECWYYLMVDLLKYFKYVIALLVMGSVIWLYLDYSNYLLCGLIYLLVVMIKDFYLSYSMSKLVYQYNQKDDFE